MALIRRLVKRLRALLWRGAVERELDEELRFHLELETTKNVEAGMSPADARRKALVDFGGIEQTKEVHRDVRGGRWIEEALADARYALRTLRRNPALAGAAILTLALGIGANTAIFSAVNAVILRPLPFPHPERLVMLSEDNAEKGWVRNVVAPANYLDWKERVKSFAEVAAYTGGGGATISNQGVPQRVRVRGVSGNYFSVLGAQAEAGRTFEDGETWQTGTPVAVISHRFWLDAFGGDPATIGRTIPIDGRPTQIVGVMPARFSFAADTMDIWQPMGWDPQSRTQDFFRRAHWLRVIARLKPGVTPEAADAEFQTVVRRLQVEFPATNRVMGADLVPLHEFLIGDVRTALLMLQGAVALLLLIACANVGNLLLVRALGREREVSLRLTLGAGRARLVRQAFTESLVLSALGGAAGFALGWWGTRALAALQPAGMLPVADVPMDVRVLAAILSLTTLTGLIFGIAPALWSAHRVPAEVLKEGGRSETGHGIRRWGDALVAGEIALALMLTLGAGLLVRSFWRLQRVDPGVDSRGVLVVGIRLGSGYQGNPSSTLAFFDALRERVRAMPGVSGASQGMIPPFGGTAFTSDFRIESHAPDDFGVEIARDRVTPDYFSTLRVPLKAGRFITEADRMGATPVVVINEALARQQFKDRDPIGQRITFSRVADSTSVWRTIVGVVGDVHQTGLAVQPQIAAYEAFAQSPTSYMTLLVRTPGDVESLVPGIRRIVGELDPNLALAQVQLLERLQERSIARQRFIMSLILVFAATGFLLALVGVYGVMAQMARRRTREMGIRLALGAQASDVQWLVMRHALAVVAAGLGIGLTAALGATRGIQTLLYDVAPTDPATFVVVPALLLLTALVASWLPALRASRTAPATTLRED
jgi:putative ABC transport system permease protein